MHNEPYWEKWEEGLISPRGLNENWIKHAPIKNPNCSRLAKPTPPAWSGKGQPPVGAVCDALYNTYKPTWHTARIIGKDGGAVIGRWLEGPNDGSLFEYTNQKAFRPIRTPEQIQRDELMDVMCKSEITGAVPFSDLLSFTDAIIAAGYHK